MNHELQISNAELTIAVIGLGYVGLPLAIEFSKHFQVFGYDRSAKRITQLQAGLDTTLEVKSQDLLESSIIFTDQISDLTKCNFYVITVPTPIDINNRPDLGPLISASEIVGGVLKSGSVVVYESTVYPGCTEEDCVPVLEEASGLKFNRDFYVGYSPERINPGDKKHTLVDIIKVTSGSTPEVSVLVANVYKKIIMAGVHVAPCIKVAEAAKVIENTQRDLNIALINELALIFSKMSIDTEAVLEAAKTKWNFLPFIPGLVGGHCIGVDPYYLTHKAQSVGHHPELILAGRRLNDSMPFHVTAKFIKALIGAGINVKNAKILIMGLTFKENCPDTRNTKVLDVISELVDYGCEVECYDPWVDPTTYSEIDGISVVENLTAGKYDGVFIAVAHDLFKAMKISEIEKLCNDQHIIFDLKNIFIKSNSVIRL